jgi:CYTH domain-containing protein
MNETAMSEILDRISNRGQLSRKEYEYVIGISKNKNMLVFGCGNDSTLWRGVCKNVHFLEHNTRWIDNSHGDVTQIKYTIKMSDTNRILSDILNNSASLYLKEMDEIAKKDWDVILVDSPEGWDLKNHHGRLQSVYIANFIANNETDIIVHDIDRKVERLCVDNLLGEKILEFDRLGHYKKFRSNDS